MSKISSAQAAQIRDWLTTSGFHRQTGATDHPELWFREECQVRLIPQGSRTRVAIRYLNTGDGWRELAELSALRAAWPEANTMSPIELATLPRLHDHIHTLSFRRAPGGSLYREARPWAHGAKVVLQMLVGIGAVVDIVWHVIHSVAHHTGPALLVPSPAGIIGVIAYALAVAAAIELAYTLFTPGPDEALDPLMLGLSSGVLLLITDTNKHYSVTAQYSGVLIGVIALAALFLIRRYLLHDDDQ